MTKEQILKIILNAVGNPSSGAIKQHSDAMAEALAKELNGEKKKAPTPKETRVIEPDETR